MKKLLSALFILGSVVVLAEGVPEGANKPGDCYTNACKVDRDMKIRVQVPTQLKISCLGDIDLGKWCGTKVKTGHANYALEGEKNADVKVYFENSEVQFKKEYTNQNAGFVAYMDVDGVQQSIKKLTLPGYGGKGTQVGKVNATLYPVAQGVNLSAEGKYVATAKLIAEYDSF